MVHEFKFKFTQLDKFWKIKIDSGFKWKYEKLKLWNFFEIYVTVRDGNHEPNFCDRIPNLLQCVIQWSRTGSIKQVVLVWKINDS